MWFGNIKIENRTSEHSNRLERLNERFNRWHERQLSLSTFVINLFITIAIASIGFLLTNLNSSGIKNFRHSNEQVFNFSIYCLLLSLIFGVSALITRLNNFRYTKSIIKWRKLDYKVSQNLKYESKKELDDDFCKKKIKKFRSITNILGIVTWWMFYLQLGSFLLALTLFLLNIL